MSTLAPSGGLRPALPPTLQPMAIALAAPRTDRRTALLVSGLVYLLVPAALFAAGKVLPPIPIPGGKPPIEFVLAEPGPVAGGAPPAAAPAAPKVAEAPKTADPQVQENVNAETLETPNALPTLNQNSGANAHGDPNGVPGGTGTNPDSKIPGPGTGTPTSSLLGNGPVTIDATGLHVLHQEVPVYPALARAIKAQGTVVLRMVIDAQGIPTAVSMQEGNPVFRMEAERSARLWRFEPARVNGAAVPATFLLTLKFKLQ